MYGLSGRMGRIGKARRPALAEWNPWPETSAVMIEPRATSIIQDAPLPGSPGHSPAAGLSSATTRGLVRAGVGVRVAAALVDAAFLLPAYQVARWAAQEWLH